MLNPAAPGRPGLLCFQVFPTLALQVTLGRLVAGVVEAINRALPDTDLARQFHFSRPILRFGKASHTGRRYLWQRPTCKRCSGGIHLSSSSSEYLPFALRDRSKPRSQTFYRDDIRLSPRELPSLVFQMRIGPRGFFCRLLHARRTLAPLTRRAHPVTSHHPNPPGENLPTSTLYFRADANPEDLPTSTCRPPPLNGPTDQPEPRPSNIPQGPRLASASHPILLSERHPQYWAEECHYRCLLAFFAASRANFLARLSSGNRPRYTPPSRRDSFPANRHPNQVPDGAPHIALPRAMLPEELFARIRGTFPVSSASALPRRPAPLV